MYAQSKKQQLATLTQEYTCVCMHSCRYTPWGSSEKQKGKDPTKKAVGFRLAPLGTSALVLGFLVAPQTSKALHESLWPQKQ